MPKPAKQHGDPLNDSMEERAHEQPHDENVRYTYGDIEVTAEVARIIERLEAERDEAMAAKQRALADFKNFQRRSSENELRAASAGTTRIVRTLIPVLDQFDLMLQQNIDEMTAEQIASAVKLIERELTQALQSVGVKRIEPNVGDEFDPNQHEAVMREKAVHQDPGTVVCVLQPGIALQAQMLRPAKVSVAAGDE